MSDPMSTVDTGDGPRALSDAELALTRTPGPVGSTPAPGPVPEDPPPADPPPLPAGGRPSLDRVALDAAALDATLATAEGLLETSVLAVFSGGWVYLDGTGWRRLAGPGLAAIAAAARGTGGRVVVRLSADGTVTEMYVW